MNSEAITRNDLQAILGATVGSTYMEQQITTFSSGWAVYGDDTPVTVRRFGRVVSLSGALKNTTSVTLNTTDVTVFTLPEGYRPSQTLHSINESTNNGIFLMRVQPNGAVQFARWRINTTTFPSVASGYWFPFHITYITDDLAVNEALPALMGDYVVEQGTDGNWDYRKWNSGKYEAWQFFTGTKSLTTASANMYYNSTPFSIAFPSFSTGAEYTYATARNSLSSGVVIYSYNLAGQLDFRAHASTSNAVCSANLYVVGTWK